MALNDSNSLLTTTNSPDGNGIHSVPVYKVGTGVYTNSSGERAVVGVGTLFTTEVRPLDWLIVSGKEARQVESVPNDTLIWLREGFSGGSGAGVKVYIAPRSPYKQITIFPQTGSACTIDGNAAQASAYYDFEGSPTCNPKTVVVTGNSVETRVSNAE